MWTPTFELGRALAVDGGRVVAAETLFVGPRVILDTGGPWDRLALRVVVAVDGCGER